MNNKQKLELTWIGKGEEPKLEPRILLYDEEKSYGDQKTGNMLIHGDNLLALKALEQDYAGKVKCIYIEIIMQRLIQFNDCHRLLPLAG
ncbi:MAG: hypothetical protein WA131_00675 [Desulfitobacteriaceae bacterium]